MLETRAAIGTAETPAEPISGLIFFSFGKNTFISFAIRTPPAVATANANKPRTIIPSERPFIIFSGVIWLPTPSESKIETMFIISFSIVLERRSTTPHCFTKFPNASIPIKGAAEGSKSIVTTSKTSGNKTFSALLTGRNCSIRISRSCLVVSARIIGG